MPAVVRDGDSLSTGHGCDGSTTLANPGDNDSVYANSILGAVPGADTVSHLIENPAPPPPLCISHTAKLNAGSPNVFINGNPWGRIGDSADKGAMKSGSPNVFANGG